MPRPLGNPVIAGYDVVSYFENGKAVRGSKKFRILLEVDPPPSSPSSERQGAPYLHEFWFSGENSKRAFKRQPEKYLPRFGGFCAWGLAVEFTDEALAALPSDFPDRRFRGSSRRMALDKVQPRTSRGTRGRMEDMER